MASKLTLAHIRIVLTGEFGEMDAEDVKWDLITLGASVMKTVRKNTGALIAGENPKQSHIDRADKLGIPILDVNGLHALLDGALLHDVVAGRVGGGDERAEKADLSGKKVAITGTFVGATQSSLASALEDLGANVVNKPSKSLDFLVVGQDLGMAAVEVMNNGVPFLDRDALDALLGGAPLSDFIGPCGPRVDDPAARMREILDEVYQELVSIESVERWDDQLSVTLCPDGRVVAALRDLGGTPVHDHVRQVIQRQSWPTVTAECTVSIPFVLM